MEQVAHSVAYEDTVCLLLMKRYWNKISSSDLLPDCVFKPTGITEFYYINCFVKQDMKSVIHMTDRAECE